MHRQLIGMIILLAAPCFADEPAQIAVDVYRANTAALTASDRSEIATWAIKVVETANFNSINQPQIGGSVQTIQQNYRRMLTRDHVVITYDRPLSVKSISGEVTFCEIVIGLARNDEFISTLYTIADDGRVVEFGKFGGILPQSLRLTPGSVPASQPSSPQTRKDLSWTHFSTFAPGQPLDQLHARVGEPARDVGTGLQILENYESRAFRQPVSLGSCDPG